MLGCGELIHDEPRYVAHDDRINNLAKERFEQTSGFSRHANITAFLQIIVPRLWLMILMCRDSQIRTRSVAILKGRHYQEGQFDSMVAGRTAEAAIELKNLGLSVRPASDIPLHSRICIEGVKTWQTRRKPYSNTAWPVSHMWEHHSTRSTCYGSWTATSQIQQCNRCVISDLHILQKRASVCIMRWMHQADMLRG